MKKALVFCLLVFIVCCSCTTRVGNTTAMEGIYKELVGSLDSDQLFLEVRGAKIDVVGLPPVELTDDNPYEIGDEVCAVSSSVREKFPDKGIVSEISGKHLTLVGYRGWLHNAHFELCNK